MSRHSAAITAIFILLALTALLAVGRLFILRFDSGDTFPPYSSLRSDPLGSRALYQSLELMEGLKLSRNYRPLSKLAGEGRTLLLPGAGLHLLQGQGEQSPGAGLERFARQGNRVVIAFRDGAIQEYRQCDLKDKKQQGGIFGVQPERIAPKQTEAVPFDATLTRRDLPLPEKITVHQNIAFHTTTPEWEAVYSSGNRPVILERRMGKGSIVLLSESYLFSNEAISSARQTAIIAWLLGESREIVFDEFHLGVAEQGGIVSLARSFGLYPLIASLLLLALLHLWNVSVPLVAAQPPEMSARSGLHQRDSFSGLVNLLKRSVPEKDLVQTCLSQWKKGAAKEMDSDRGLWPVMQEAAAARSNPLETYRKIARLRVERKKR